MKKILSSLPARLVVGVAAGILVGLACPGLHWGEVAVGEMVMQVVLTLKSLMGSLISFCVPLIIIGFIAPSITRLKSNASRMLGLALVLAYTSSVCAALLSMGAGYVIIPGLSIQSAVDGLRETPELLFNLEIAPIMSVMSALVFSVLVGLAATWTQAAVITQVLEEFQRIVLAVVTRVVIPILPFFIAGTFCGLAYEGSITKQLPVFLIVILIVMAGHYLWLAVLYGLVRAMPTSTDTTMPIQKGCSTVVSLMSWPKAEAAAPMAGAHQADRATPAQMVTRGVTRISTLVSLETALPISAARMAMTSTARGPPAPPRPLAAEPTAMREKRTSGGA